MLEPGSLFALDAGNQRVPGVVVPNLESGLQLVGQGPVTSLVGRLRPAIRVVDVDLSGDRGIAVVQSLASWCSAWRLWHLVRPSGGAPGRGHVYVAPGGQLAALEEVLADLRRQYRAGPRTIDLRVAVRPLSAPHRTGVVTRPAGDLQAVLAALRATLSQPGADNVAPPAVAAGASRGRVAGRAEQRSRLTPRRPTSTPVPPAWRDYLERGVRPRIAGDDIDKRSNYEAIATAALLRAGRDVDEAWAEVQRAHPDAFTKARERGRSWWSRCVWEPAVRAHDQFAPLPRRALAPAAAVIPPRVPGEPVDPPAPGEPTAGDADVTAAVEAARAAVYATAWALTPRARPAFLLVMHTVLDRMVRERSRRVPVPERDLVLDTGLTDRATIRAQLHRGDGPVGRLDRSTWDPGRRDTSSFEFEIPPADGPPPTSGPWGGVWEIHPPSSHTPSGSGVPPGLWGALPAIAHQLWRVLGRYPHPVALKDLGVQAQVVATPSTSLSPSQVRATRAALAALADVGLAGCTAAGEWFARSRCTPAAAAAAQSRRAAPAAAVQQERAGYRARLQGGRVWDAQRALALKANRAREVAWWRGLPAGERTARSAAWAARYEGLTVYEQQQVKRQLAERRVRAGVDEQVRHDAWVDGLRMDDLMRRAVTRAGWFAAMPRPKQQAYAAMWAEHRADYGIPRGTPLATSRLEFAAALPHSPSRRDESFLNDQLPLRGPRGERFGAEGQGA